MYNPPPLEIRTEDLIEKERRTRQADKKPGARGCRRFGLIGLIFMSLSSLLLGVFVTGNDFGLIGKSGNLKSKFTVSSRSPSFVISSLVPGAVHEYTFAGMQDYAILLQVQFPLGGKSPAKFVKFYDRTGLRSVGTAQGANGATISMIFDHSDVYTLQITGAAGSAQGLYLVTAASYNFSLPELNGR